MVVSLFIAFLGPWVIFLVDLPVLFPVNLVLITLDCLIWVGDGTVMVSPLVLVRVVIISFLPLFSISLVIRMERLLSFLMAH